MSTIASAPPEAPGHPPAGARRAWSRWAAVAVAVLMAGFGSWFGVFVSNYQPLHPKFTVIASGGRGRFLPAHAARPQFGVPCRVGAHARFGFPLYNEGPLGVTITKLGSPSYRGDVLTWQGRSMGPPHSTEPGGQRPFSPFSLGPNDYRVVMWDLTIHQCQGRSSVITPAFVRVGFRVLGFSRTQDLDLPLAVAVSRTGRMRAA
jgi:hypothetical protein